MTSSNCLKRGNSGSVYLDFVERTFDTIWERQSLRLSGSVYPSSPLCLTITSMTARGFLSLGHRTENGFFTGTYPSRLPDERATRMDLSAWDVLRRLAEADGDSRYGEMLDTMSQVFADYGFDTRSGLAYWGQEAEFDVLLLGPGTNWDGGAMPKYKLGDGIPRDVMWQRATQKMARLSKSAYYGLVVDEANMDFNRWCFYGWDDHRKSLSMPWSSTHRAFATSGAWLIEDWVDHHCRTGDPETLDWARRMTEKWSPVQNPDTGLISHFFGSTMPEETDMAAQPVCDVFSDPHVGVALLRAASQLRRHGIDNSLADQLWQMGLRKIRGMARYGYDDRAGLFPRWLRLSDGSESDETILYAFRTREQKEQLVRLYPELEPVNVFEGFEFYRGGFWADGTFQLLPVVTAQMAELTGDGYLLERAAFFADRVMEAAARLDGPRNDEGQWTYDATAGYIEMMLSLRRLTADDTYLDRACRLADMELDTLGRDTGTPEWWRMPYRNKLLSALLSLSEVVTDVKSALTDVEQGKG